MSTLDLNLPHTSKSTAAGPVQCLGRTFPSDEARREHYTARLRAALEELSTLDVPFTSVDDAVARLRALEHWPAVEEERLRDLAERMRGAERGKSLLQRWKDEVGFPHGELEDILRLSDPPYYTACPNPFLGEFVQAYGRPFDPAEPYHREPFAADVKEGKNDPIYNAHSYHTKVPHKAIMRYILHYTQPGDVVFDGFCGTGMTGVAAQMCGDRKTVESLGYRVEADGTILQQEPDENGRMTWKPFSRLGARRAVLNDLSPAATFIAYNYNTPVDVAEFEREAKRILQEVEEECGWMYATLHNPTPEQLERAVKAVESGVDPKHLTRDPSLRWGRINYTVWSDVILCPHCSAEIIYSEAAFNRENGKVTVRESFECTHCSAKIESREREKLWTSDYDPFVRTVLSAPKQVPVLINYSIGTRRYEKTLDPYDLAVLGKISSDAATTWVPTAPMMHSPPGEPWGEEWRPGRAFAHVHQYYQPRALRILGALLHKAGNAPQLVFLHGSILPKMTSMNRYMPQHGSRALVGPMANTLYLPPLCVENNALDQWEFQKRKINNALGRIGFFAVSNEAAQNQLLPSNSADYIFVDPPFGSNIQYAELSFLREAWLKVYTANRQEAVESKFQRKDADVYRHLIATALGEAFRVLKPGRWITVEFSNTQAGVWNTLQNALQQSGFVVASVDSLSKERGGLHAMLGNTAVKQDLVISAYKPNGGLEERFVRNGGTETSVWDFIHTHFEYLPVFKNTAGRTEFITERDPRILYDRVVAWFVRHGTPVPLSSQEFQAGLAQRFVERDGMYFLPDQVAEYDRKVRQAGVAPQQELFVSDERSAIDWLREFLKKRPSVYSDVQPDFMRQIGAGWSKYEARPELRDLLELNFLQYDGRGEVPSQIHGYLSHSYADLRNLAKDDPKLVARAKDRWYVPDPNKAIDLEKLREKQLLKEFEEYRGFGGRKLKVFRLEAVRAGFRKAWQERDYDTIVEVAKKLPEAVLQEDPLLLRWYDNALTRLGAE